MPPPFPSFFFSPPYRSQYSSVLECAPVLLSQPMPPGSQTVNEFPFPFFFFFYHCKPPATETVPQWEDIGLGFPPLFFFLPREKRRLALNFQLGHNKPFSLPWKTKNSLPLSPPCALSFPGSLLDTLIKLSLRARPSSSSFLGVGI